MRLLMPVVMLLMVAGSGLAREEAERREVPATTGTKRIDFTPREWVEVGLDVDGMRVDRVKLHPAGRMTSLMLQHDEANRGKVVVTNMTDRRISPSLAVAVFDAEGNLLAAANTGIRMKALNPGQTKELEIHFGGVFRQIEQGRTLYVSLEY